MARCPYVSDMQECPVNNAAACPFAFYPVALGDAEPPICRLGSPGLVPSVLVVDDNEIWLQLMRMRLRSAGLEVAEAQDTATARMLLRHSAPDLIITDWEMPDGGGSELLAGLQGETRTSAIPVIVLTADPGLVRVRSHPGGGNTSVFDKAMRWAELLGEAWARIAAAPLAHEVVAGSRYPAPVQPRPEVPASGYRALFDSLLRHSFDAIALNAIRSEEFSQVSDSFCELTGYSREELLGHTSVELGLIQDDEEHRRAIANAGQGRSGLYTTKLRRKDGTDRLVEYSQTPGPAGEFVLTILRDVTRGSGGGN